MHTRAHVRETSVVYMVFLCSRCPIFRSKKPATHLLQRDGVKVCHHSNAEAFGPPDTPGQQLTG